MAHHNLMKIFLHLTLTLLLANATEARIGYFWHITDLHLDTIYSTQGDVHRSCWRLDREPSSAARRLPGRFGDYLCDSPWSLIESAAKAMKSRQGDNVEFVLWTGDGLSHSAHRMNEAKKFEILRNITDLLSRTFSSQFVFPVLGHEDATTTKFSRMGELWRLWLPSEALHTFERGGYYSIEQTRSRLRIIVLNTNFMRHDLKYAQSHLAAVRQRTPTSQDTPEYRNYYYQHGNMHQHHGHMSDWSGHGYSYNGHHRGYSAIPPDGGGIASGSALGNAVNAASGGRVSALSEFENQEPEKQWSWLEDVLSKSRNNKETVYIVGHMPPGSDERHIGLQQNGLNTFTESTNKRYLDLVREYSGIIQGQFFGHLHSDSFRIIYDDKGTPVSWIMMSPSVTPRKVSGGSNNPAMRLYKFDTDSGQVLDYTQYYLDLQAANTMGEPNWVPEYNLTHYYALNDISAISLHNFVDRFTGSDGTWFAKYYRANSVRYEQEQCEGVCMLNHYCAITRVDYTEFRQCLEKEQSALRSHAASPPTTTARLVALLLFLTCVPHSQRLLKFVLQVIAGMQQIRKLMAKIMQQGKRQLMNSELEQVPIENNEERPLKVDHLIHLNDIESPRQTSNLDISVAAADVIIILQCNNSEASNELSIIDTVPTIMSVIPKHTTKNTTIYTATTNSNTATTAASQNATLQHCQNTCIPATFQQIWQHFNALRYSLNQLLVSFDSCSQAAVGSKTMLHYATRPQQQHPKPSSAYRPPFGSELVAY